MARRPVGWPPGPGRGKVGCVILSFRSAVEARDPDALRRALHPDVILNPPTGHAPVVGRDAVLALMEHVRAVMPDVHYVEHLQDDRSHALAFRATVGDLEVDGIDYCQVDDDGLVRELWVYVRPASALTALIERMSARLAGAPA